MSITLVQATTSKPTGGTTPASCAVTFTSNVTANNLLIVVIEFGGNTGTSYTCSDNQSGGSNTWTEFLSTEKGTTTNDLTAFWAIPSASGALTVTILATFSGGGTHGARMGAYEYNSSTGWAASPVGVHNAANTASNVTTITPGNITPTAAGNLLVSYWVSGNITSAITVNAPFTEQPAGGTVGWTSDGQGRADGADDQNSPSTSTTCTWNWTTAVAASAIIQEFKVATASTLQPDEDFFATTPQAILSAMVISTQSALALMQALPLPQPDELPAAPIGGQALPDDDYWAVFVIQPDVSTLNIYS